MFRRYYDLRNDFTDFIENNEKTIEESEIFSDYVTWHIV